MNAKTKFASKALMEERSMAVETHLTEEQIDGHLLGDLEAQGAEHLAACALCMGRVTQAAEPMASFREATMAWSQRRSATMPMPVVEAQGLVWQRRMGWVTATFVLGLGLALLNNGRRAMTASEQEAQAAAPQDARAVIPVEMALVKPAVAAVDSKGPNAADENRVSADNTMLRAVDVELKTTVESPAALGLETMNEKAESDSSQPVRASLSN